MHNVLNGQRRFKNLADLTESKCPEFRNRLLDI